jgi:polyhydroxyalkanoate synthesis regulator phasin
MEKEKQESPAKGGFFGKIWNKFGEVAVHLGLVNDSNIEKALAKQATDKPRRRLGETLVAAGKLTKDQVKEVLKIQKEWFGKAMAKEPIVKTGKIWDKFGEVAVYLGLVSDSIVEKALAKQATDKPRRRLGETLVAAGKLTKDQVKEVLRIQKEWFGKATAKKPTAKAGKKTAAKAKPAKKKPVKATATKSPKKKPGKATAKKPTARAGKKTAAKANLSKKKSPKSKNK